MLILHILIALTGLIVASYGLLRPHQRTIAANYILLASTLATGTILTLQSSAQHLVSACLSGLTYTAAIVVMQLLTKTKLAKQPVRKD